MSAFIIYLIDVFGQLNEFAALASILSFVVSLVLFFVGWAEAGSQTSACRLYKLGKTFSIAGISCAIIACIIPSKTTMAAMYILPKIEQSKAIQEDLPEIYNLAVEHLKKSLNVENEKKGEK